MIPKFTTTAIGSLPFKDVNRAVEFHLSSLDIPCWPQLPKLSYYENMYVQFSEGLPGVVIEEAEKKIYIEEIKEKDLSKFLSAIIENDYEYFGISEKYARGLYQFKKRLKAQRLKFVKGQITGPVSFGLAVPLKSGEAIFYDEELREMMVRHLKMKALWEYEFLKDLAQKIIIFLDEPYLSSIGSGFITISEEQILASLREIVQALKEKGVIVGIHCCGNTDWTKLIKVGFEIINYDCYNYPQSLLLLPELVNSHIKGKDNYIAWGIVPSSNEIKKTEILELLKKMDESFQSLKNKHISLRELINKSLLTPSCGTATLGEEEACLVYEKLEELKERLLKEV